MIPGICSRYIGISSRLLANAHIKSHFTAFIALIQTVTIKFDLEHTFTVSQVILIGTHINK